MLYIVFMVHAAFCYSTKPDVHVVLGSANEIILGERIHAAIQYIRSTENPNIFFSQNRLVVEPDFKSRTT
jgi:hypothetical protein